MKVLIVASYNKKRFAPFVVEQVEALKRAGCEISYYGVEGTGVVGYLKALPGLKHAIKSWHPDLIHAHYGLCGLLANFQRKTPVVTTYHGSDINQKKIRPFSRLSVLLSSCNVFVSRKMLDIIKPRKSYALIPCGVDLTPLQLTEKAEARKIMGLDPVRKYVLFSSGFDNAVKNYPLAKAAVDKVNGAELIELKGYSRDQVTLLMCAVDALLLTSFTEGSPLVVKEAMTCGCPVVSVDVGDVRAVLANVDGCFVCDRDPDTLADGIEKSFETYRTLGRRKIEALELSNDSVARKLLDNYKAILKDR